MRVGLGEYKAGNLEAARKAFINAWCIKRYLDITGTVAEIEMKLGRYREAAEHWEYYLANNPPDRDEAIVQLAECRSQLASVRVSVDTPDAVIFVNERAIGIAPLDREVWLEPGSHTFHAQLLHRRSSERTIKVAMGESHLVVLEFPKQEERPIAALNTPTPRPAPVSDRLERKPEGGNTRTGVLIGGGIATAAALGVGVGYWLWAEALGENAESWRAATEREGDPGLVAINGQCSPPKGERPASCDTFWRRLDEESEARTVSNAAFIAGGILGIGTVAAFFLWPSPRERAKAAAVVLEPFSQPGIPGFEFRATF
jgi:hypothetical protein